MNDGRYVYMFVKLSSCDGSFYFLSLYGVCIKEEKKMGKPWQNISRERGIPLNDQYFMVRCQTYEKMCEFARNMEKRYGFELIDACSGGIPRGVGMFFNLTTGFMFYVNLGLNNLSGPWIGDMPIMMDEFIEIVEIYRRHTENGHFVFKNGKNDEKR